MDAVIARTPATDSSALTRQLARARYLNLTTFRKSGDPVATPVWFALVGERVYVMSDGTAGKVKRVRNNGRVRVAPSDWRGRSTGTETEATATLVIDQAERTVAERALRERYGWQWRLVAWFGERSRRRSGKPDGRVFLAITAE